MQRIRIVIYLFCFVLIGSFLPSIVSGQSGQEYKVIPVFLLANDYQEVTGIDFDTESPNYFRWIQIALDEINNFYSTQTKTKYNPNGLKFNYDKTPRVINIPNVSQEDLEDMDNIIKLIKSGGIKIDRSGDLKDGKTIFLIIPFGSSATDTAGVNFWYPYKGSKDAYIYSIIDSTFLFDLDPINASEDAQAYGRSLTVIGHELGHAFGLIRERSANGHTCSQHRPEIDCISGAPIPLPSFEEGESDLMFWALTSKGSIFNKKLHNTFHNPEVLVVYRSPFLNPDIKMAGPDLEPLLAQSQFPLVANRRIVSLGEEFSLTTGFGTSRLPLSPQPVEIYTIYNNEVFSTESLVDPSSYSVSWQPSIASGVVIKVEKVEDTDEKWFIRFRDPVKNIGYFTESNNYILVKGGKSQKYFVTSRFNATCGDENLPVTGSRVTVNYNKSLGESREILSSYLDKGSTTMSFSPSNYAAKRFYFIIGDLKDGSNSINPDIRS